VSLPTQQHVIKAIARTMGELGGLRDGLLRLATDLGSGIDVNRSLARQRPDGSWEVDRLLPRVAQDAATATVALAAPLSDGQGNEMPIASTELVVNQDDGTRTFGQADVAMDLPSTGEAPGSDEALVSVVLTIPDPPPDGGPLWTGRLLHDRGGPTPDEYRVEFWVRDLP
jgi:hypothetical protein